MSTDTRPARERLAVLEMQGEQIEVPIVRDGEQVVGDTALPGAGDLLFTATQVRRERTGVHARLVIGFPGNGKDRMLTYSWLNCDRDEDRVRLANSAARRMGGDHKGRGEQIKARLDIFCAQLWDAWIHTDEGWWVQPDENGSAPSWLLEPYLLHQGGTILFGPPGACKSWIALMWAIGLTHGVGPWKHTQTSVLFVNLERSAKSIQWRVARVCRALGIPPKPMLAMSARGRSLTDVWDAARRTVERHEVGLVIVDSLSRAGTGDLNANSDANRAMDAMNALATSWMTIAHTPRTDTTHTYGSQMFDGAADLCVRLTSSAGTDDDDEKIGVQLEVTKANDVRKAKGQVWALGFDEGGLRSIGPASAGEFPDLSPASVSVVEQIESYLKESGTATVQEIADETGLARPRVSEILNRTKRFLCVERGGGRGKPSTYGLRSRITEEPK